jgi:hypothetical protein
LSGVIGPTTRTPRPGPGNGWRQTTSRGSPRALPHRPDLVLEELAQRLEQLELHALGQPADVVVALDERGRVVADRDALDHVGIERPLGEEVGVADLLERPLEDLDEGPLPMILRFFSGSSTPRRRAGTRAASTTLRSILKLRL